MENAEEEMAEDVAYRRKGEKAKKQMREFANLQKKL